ncbi:MAG TPA: alpha/beta fold hydrolase [Thermoleophilaceae bacterium]|jgi:pimeloyl-ACP methyl ester carboxylesterase
MSLIPTKVLPATPWAARRAGDDYGVRAEPDWRSIDWRPHLREMEIDGRRINYVDLGEGDGPPFVFVHGLSGNWQNWLENLPRFAQERRTLALDLPGFGASEGPAGELSIPAYGRVIDEFCERLDLGEVVLIGNSMGGFSSAETAIQFPERVERLVLVSAVGITIADTARAPVMAWGRGAMLASSRSAVEKQMAIVRPRLRHLAYSMIVRHPSRIPQDLLWEISQGAGRPAFKDALEAMLDYDFRDRLPEIRCPTLVVWGEKDMLVPVADAAEFERRIPNARVVVLEDTGHVSMLERPQTFNDCVLEFLHEPRDEPSDVGRPAEGAAVT